VRFSLAKRRGGGPGGTSVTIDDTYKILPSTGATDRWLVTNSDYFVANKTSYNFRWRADPGQAVILDNVNLLSATRPPYSPIVGNGSFELPALTSGKSVNEPANAGTLWSGKSWGIANGTTEWGDFGLSSPQYAYIRSTQSVTGFVEQSVDNLIIGQTYQIQFYVAPRGGTTTHAPNNLRVLLADGTVIADQVRPGGVLGAWTRKRTATFTAKSKLVRFRIEGSLATRRNPDITTLVDGFSCLKVTP
jgi:hypothetical protein